ncbi:MAG: LysR family transcriptional regulator [Trebonia sp.]
MLDVHRLRLLRELDHRGTLAAVARALSYSPSAISQQLSQLETETGVPLLEPAGRGVRLTPQARILVEHTEAILERLEEAEADLRAALAEVRGTLRVASFQSVLFALVPSVLTRLAGRHPGLRVEIAHQEAVPAFAGLLAHDFDIVLGEEYPGTAHPPVAGARTQLLANDELFTVFPAHGRYAVGGEPGTQVRLADLAGVPWIFDPADTGPGQWRATPAGRRASSRTSATWPRTCCCRSTWRRPGTPPRSSPAPGDPRLPRGAAPGRPRG